jgi:hypothetical protein
MGYYDDFPISHLPAYTEYVRDACNLVVSLNSRDGQIGNDGHNR